MSTGELPSEAGDPYSPLGRMTQELFLAADLTENVSVGPDLLRLQSALWLSQIPPPWPQEISDTGGQTQSTRWLNSATEPHPPPLGSAWAPSCR